MSSFNYFFGILGNNYSPIATMLWLLMWLPVWGGMGYILEVEKKRRYLLLYRYQKKRKWWYRIYIRTSLWIILYFTILFILVNIYTIINHIDCDMLTSMVILLILWLHAMTTQGVMLWVYNLWCQSALAFVVVLVSEILSTFIILLGIQPKLCPFVWGMYSYSNQIFGKDGYSIDWIILWQCIWMGLTLLLPPKTKCFMESFIKENCRMEDFQ